MQISVIQTRRNWFENTTIFQIIVNKAISAGNRPGGSMSQAYDELLAIKVEGEQIFYEGTTDRCTAGGKKKGEVRSG